MNLKEKIKTKLNQNRLARRFSDYDFRTVVFTVVSLVITTGYAAFYAMLGIALLSIWYGMLACYYIMLVVMRAVVVFYHRRKRKRGENINEHKEKISRAKIYKNCGIVICLLTLPLSIAILLMVAEKASFSHEGLMIYVSATYTFYKVVMTIRHLVKARKSTDMTVKAVRSINIADMLVSVLALQTAMFHSFSADFNTDIFNAVTGAAVCLLTVIIGVFMIVGGKSEITKINYEANLKNQQRG
ncbi:MAG: hypothetical protein K2K38_06695 [Clostridia bacterium]|nr:hypothetical protein [Clostridia bacterium]